MRKVPKLTAEASDVRDAIRLRRWHRAQAGLSKVTLMVFILFSFGAITTLADLSFPASYFPTTGWSAEMRRNLESVMDSISFVAGVFLIFPGLYILGYISWKLLATVMYRRAFDKIATADAHLRTPRAWYEFDGGKKNRKLSPDFARNV